MRKKRLTIEESTWGKRRKRETQSALNKACQKKENIKKSIKKGFKRHTQRPKQRNMAVGVNKENLCYVFEAVEGARAAKGREKGRGSPKLREQCGGKSSKKIAADKASLSFGGSVRAEPQVSYSGRGQPQLPQKGRASHSFPKER